MRINNPIDQVRTTYQCGHKSAKNLIKTILLGTILIISFTSSAKADSIIFEYHGQKSEYYSDFDRNFSNFNLPPTEKTAVRKSNGGDDFVGSSELQSINPPLAGDATPSLEVDSNPVVGPGASVNRNVVPTQDQIATDRLRNNPPKWKDVRELEFAYQVLNIIDGIETLDCLDRHRCSEMNPILGRRPSTGRMIAVKASSGVLHYVITRYLLKKHPEWVDEWMITTVVGQGGVVFWNLQHCF